MSFGTGGPKDQYEKLSLFGVQDKKFGASGFNPLSQFRITKGSLKDPEKTLNTMKKLIFPEKQYHKVGPQVRFAEVVLNGLSDDLRKDPDFIAQLAMAIPKRYPQLKVQILRRAKHREDMPGSTLEALKRNERSLGDDTMGIDGQMSEMTDALKDVEDDITMVDGIAGLLTK